MKSRIPLALLVLAFAGCNSGQQSSPSPAGVNSTSEGRYAYDSGPSQPPATTAPQAPEIQKVSLTDAGVAASAAEAVDRKIIRNANLTIEVNSTTDTQHRITSIAESYGGFVVTSEAKQRENTDPEKRTLDIKLVVRIPSSRFGPALDEIRKLATTLREENVAGQDVTEEFIDLEARIKTQRALELQFLEIMKQARAVSDALEVQRQISDVRTDIEKLEGRKRFLENRASLSTITVNLEAPRQIAVNTTGFGRSLRDAVSESVELGSGLLLFLVRFVIIMVPITIFILLPLGLLVRYFLRRARRIQMAQQLATPVAE